MTGAARLAPGTAERPLRVVVLGSSTTFMVVPRPDTVDDEPYPGLLDEALCQRGVVARTTLHGRWHATAPECARRLEEWVRDPLPDVLVVNLGMADCQARVLPTWFYRNVHSWLPGFSGPATAYRRRVAPRLRRAVRAWNRLAAPHAPLALSRVRPSVFRRAMELLVVRPVRDFRVLVLVLDIDPPGPAIERAQPGLAGRVTAYNRVLADLVRDRDDPRVQLVRTSELVADDPQRLLPDGLHRSAEGHRRVAAALADAVVSRWSLLAPGS